MVFQLKQFAKTVLPSGLLSNVRRTRALAGLAWNDFRREVLGNMFPLKPGAISLMANDICNARCQMCLIWKRKRDHEITPEELGQVLAEPLFDQVQFIGVTGGEPTLRKDLPELFRVLAAKIPKIESASIITNAIRAPDVQARVLECSRICQTAGIGFAVMVSLDGIGEVHDLVRGREGNFRSAVESMERFRAEKIAVEFGCTITTSNAAYVDELLEWAQDHGYYGHFRVAEFIDRLYNASQTEFIRSFDAITQYHLGLFFFRLEHDFETNPMYQKTYRSIRGMLVEGKGRTTGCAYHHDAVILSSRGELLYCSPKSPILGSILERGSAKKVFFGNLEKRQEIRKNHCDTCIHDYHVPETFHEKLNFYLKSHRIARRYDSKKLLRRARRIRSAGSAASDPAHLKSGRVLIVGWFGTETVGDKAILSTIVDRLRGRRHPPRSIVVSSLFPFVTEWTKRELEIPDLDVVETYGSSFEALCESVDEVVMGGGPLMDLSILDHVLYAFTGVAARGGVGRVEGCGLGPLQDPLYIEMVGEILRLATHVTLRDSKSVERADRQFQRQARLTNDPAVDYVRAAGAALSGPPGTAKVPVICTYLREWGRDYAYGLSDAEYGQTKSALDFALVQMLCWLAEESGCAIKFMPMHSFHVGGDDRVYNRRVARSMAAQGVPLSRVDVMRLPASPRDIVNSMKQARFSVCMRFHSVLFAETLDVPFIAIDYTRGGKIHAFLEERGKSDRMLTLDDVISGAWKGRCASLLNSAPAG